MLDRNGVRLKKNQIVIVYNPQKDFGLKSGFWGLVSDTRNIKPLICVWCKKCKEDHDMTINDPSDLEVIGEL